ncbi:MAG: hypothetical protein ABSH05_23195 [Bryobacteraceae bacterium]
MTTDTSLAAIAAAGQTPAAEAAGFPFVVIPPQISFLTKNVPPPSPAYVGSQDQLMFVVYNVIPDQTITIQVRMLMPSGELKQNRWDFPVTSDRALNCFMAPLAEGFLLTMSVYAQGGSPPGSCYAFVFLMAASAGEAPIAQTLAYGYLTDAAGLVWPYPRWTLINEGPGNIRLIQGTNPAPQHNISETVPTGARWRLISVFCRLSTSATAGNRYVGLWVVDPAGTFVSIPAVAGQPPSLVWSYTWGSGLAAAFDSNWGHATAPLPDYLFLTSGQSFSAFCYPFQAADDFTAPLYLVEEWLVPS